MPPHEEKDFQRLFGREKGDGGRVRPRHHLCRAERGTGSLAALLIGLLAVERSPEHYLGRLAFPPFGEVYAPADGRQGNRVLGMGIGKNPVPIVHQEAQRKLRTFLKDFFAEEFGPFGSPGTAGKHNAHSPAVGAEQMPKPPAKGFVKVRIAGSHSGIGSGHQGLSEGFGGGKLGLVKFKEIRPLLPQDRLSLFLIPLGQSAKTRIKAGPKGMFLDPGLLPRGISEDDIEPRPRAKKYLRKS